MGFNFKALTDYDLRQMLIDANNALIDRLSERTASRNQAREEIERMRVTGNVVELEQLTKEVGRLTTELEATRRQRDHWERSYEHQRQERSRIATKCDDLADKVNQKHLEIIDLRAKVGLRGEQSYADMKAELEQVKKNLTDAHYNNVNVESWREAAERFRKERDRLQEHNEHMRRIYNSECKTNSELRAKLKKESPGVNWEALANEYAEQRDRRDMEIDKLRSEMSKALIDADAAENKLRTVTKDLKEWVHSINQQGRSAYDMRDDLEVRIIPYLDR